MKFISHFIKKHWLWALLILLVLWLLPKLVNAYAYLFQTAGELVDKVGKFLKLPQETIAKGVAAVAKLAKTLADTPILTFIVPVLLFSVAPIAAALLSVWGLLDLFKPHETITITRVSPAVTSPATTSTGDTSSPLLMPDGQTVDDFYSSPF